MTTPTESSQQYHEYLKGSRWTGHLYHRLFLYPRIARFLSGRVIDIGCGLGAFLAYRRDTVGVDVNQANVEFCLRRGLQAHPMKKDRFPFCDSLFDGALMDNVLEHVEDPSSLMSETRRVLREGGTLLIGVPGRKGFASDPDHKIYYDRERLMQTAHPFGFDEISHFYAPFRCSYFENRLRQYCLYGIFRLSGKKPASDLSGHSSGHQALTGWISNQP